MIQKFKYKNSCSEIKKERQTGKIGNMKICSIEIEKKKGQKDRERENEKKKERKKGREEERKEDKNAY